jgi:hypothetical protein
VTGAPEQHDPGLDAPDESRDDGAAAAPSTGNARVDAATALLADLDVRPTSEHAPVFEEVHQRLHSALADLDDE